MQLKQIYLNREEYGSSKGLLVGSVLFTGVHGEIKLTITPEQANRFLAVFADALVESSKETAKKLTYDLILSQNQAAIEDNSKTI